MFIEILIPLEIKCTNKYFTLNMIVVCLKYQLFCRKKAIACLNSHMAFTKYNILIRRQLSLYY